MVFPFFNKQTKMYRATGVSLQQIGMAETIRGRQPYGVHLNPDEFKIINDIIHVHDDTNPNVLDIRANDLRTKYNDGYIVVNPGKEIEIRPKKIGIERYEYDDDVQEQLEAISDKYKLYLDDSVTPEMAQDSYQRRKEKRAGKGHEDTYTWQQKKKLDELEEKEKNNRMIIQANLVEINSLIERIGLIRQRLEQAPIDNMRRFSRVFQIPHPTEVILTPGAEFPAPGF